MGEALGLGPKQEPEPEPLINRGSAPATPRLTADQYRNAVTDLFGPGLPTVPLEVDTAPNFFTTIGAAQTSISPDGVRYWEQAALAISRTVFDDAARRRALVGCDPVADEDCVPGFIARFGQKVWRRPLLREEIDNYVRAAGELGGSDPWKGLFYAVAGMLESPNFVYRAAFGEPDPEDPTRNRYTAWEMASRLSFPLLNSTPDDELIEAASNGDLLTEEGVRAQAARLLELPRGRAGIRTFFSQYFQLTALDRLNRDVTLFPRMSPTLGASMREEVERMAEDVVFEQDVDVRELFSTRLTYVNAELAAFYGLPAISPESGFVLVRLPESVGRAGLLTTAGVLASASHSTRTSPTRRGIMVRGLFCETIPPPPPDAMTELTEEMEPEPGAPPQTLREKLERHRSDARCASCHALMDPIGLGLEEFDAIGARRTEEGGRPIDTRGEIDEMPFEGGVELGRLLRESEKVPRCLLTHLYRYATGRLETEEETLALDAVNEQIASLGYGFKDMVIELVASEAFRYLPAQTNTSEPAEESQ